MTVKKLKLNLSNDSAVRFTVLIVMQMFDGFTLIQTWVLVQTLAQVLGFTPTFTTIP